MASNNPGQGRRNNNEGHDRGNNGGAGQPTPQATQQVTDRFREGYDAAREELSHRYRRAEGTIARNPGNSVLIGFGLGFGIGLAVTAMLNQHEETWADRYLPDSLRDLPDTLRNAHVPESVRGASSNVHSTFHHLAESIRDLPSAIARAMPSR